MTDLQKTVKRRSIGTLRRRRFIVSLHPGDVISFREERTRKTYSAPLAVCFDFVLKLNVAADKRAKREAKGKK